MAITFLLLIISSWNFHDVCQRFLNGHKRNFSWIRQKNRNFPTTIIKIANFCNTKVGDFYNGGLWGSFLSDQAEISFLYKNRWHTSWKFQLEIISNKKVIAKKPLTNFYEMNSISSLLLTHLNSYSSSKYGLSRNSLKLPRNNYIYRIVIEAFNGTVHFI